MLLVLFDESHYAPSHQTIGSVEPLFWLDECASTRVLLGVTGAVVRPMYCDACAYPCAWSARHTLCPNTAQCATPVPSETGPRVWPSGIASSVRTPQCT